MTVSMDHTMDALIGAAHDAGLTSTPSLHTMQLWPEIESILTEYGLRWETLGGSQQEQLLSVEADKHCRDAEAGAWDPQCVRKGYRCYIDSWTDSARLTIETASGGSGSYCPPKFDGYNCWPAQKSGQLTAMPCSQAIPAEILTTCQRLLPTLDTGTLHAFRECSEYGVWEDARTNYSACHNYVNQCTKNMTDLQGRYNPLTDTWPFDLSSNNSLLDGGAGEVMDEETKQIVTYVFAGLAITSLVLLSISFFIFAYFKTLHCSRNSIHMNLFAALMLQAIALLTILSPRISGDETLHRSAWLCKSFMFLSLFTVPASIFWTFVEGLYLSQRLTLAVFRKEAPFRMYVFIGWGIPLVLVSIWALMTELHVEPDATAALYASSVESVLPISTHTISTLNHTVLTYSATSTDDQPFRPPTANTCWQNYSNQPYHWIITGPCLAALTVNFIFLVLIIIILVTKLRANNAVETVQLRKAIKATFFLVPLLGISNLLFFANPRDKGPAEKAYLVVNLVLKGSQGIFVALIYCFLNSEVRMAIQKKFYRAALRRNPETQSFRLNSLYERDRDQTLEQRRKSSSRAGSTTLVSSTEVMRAMFRSRRSSSRASHKARAASLQSPNGVGLPPTIVVTNGPNGHPPQLATIGPSPTMTTYTDLFAATPEPDERAGLMETPGPETGEGRNNGGPSNC
ncbi:corticotropin-releasing factor receptor 2-like [Paramacrobiotus metropolitanus]|uniref:corticotropin-releasing factor receptor 2-like n=1 Tax=Paramacrobiotus metropolitanus TaxID=2943436 RepID=UPI0024460796|nr:corticotropin-releasing factor receptor 2-like [Paramacrobiotus metropolitanus]XP_055354143.1 corticotropin-releasing factor receptor 2-like [Paramacrobiotus metropolitanus]